jgi:hypothetical protein
MNPNSFCRKSDSASFRLRLCARSVRTDAQAAAESTASAQEHIMAINNEKVDEMTLTAIGGYESSLASL